MGYNPSATAAFDCKRFPVTGGSRLAAYSLKRRKKLRCPQDIAAFAGNRTVRL
uniref:Uncharacterized protein n=1 Tax=Faecalibaculum rodentium TaxID=1702221 RepID=A0A140DV38_9FIRM|nr:hypothetical protein AALO17_13810 [Faecalibaculum rodentium]